MNFWEKEKKQARKSLDRWAHRWFGKKGPLVLLIIFIAGSLFLFIIVNRSFVSKLPGISSILDLYHRTPIPQADPERFSILVAKLENDENREGERLIVESLKEYKGLQVLRLDRTIPLEGSVPVTFPHSLGQGEVESARCLGL